VPHSRGTASEILEEGGDDVKSAWPLVIIIEKSSDAKDMLLLKS
jgi:hypothetical protein